MRAGRLRQRVTVQTLVQAPNAYGQVATSYADGATLWAFVRTPTGRELTFAGQLQAQLSHVVELRYPDAATLLTLVPSSRLSWDGRTLDISSVRDPDGRRRTLFVDCSELIPAPEPDYTSAGMG